MSNIDTISAASYALTTYLSDIARRAAEIHSYTRDARRAAEGSPAQQSHIECAQIALAMTRSTLDRLQSVIASAELAASAQLQPSAEPTPEPKQLGDVAAVALSDCLAASPMSERLVPRFPTVKSSGAAGVAVRATVQDPQP